MKRTMLVMGLVGLTMLGVLIARERVGAILAPLSQAGWRLLWLVPLHLIPLALDASGWRLLVNVVDPERHARGARLIGIAAVREAVSRLLPIAGVGGELVGIRMLVRLGVDGAAAAASVVVEVMLTLVALYLFTVLGLLSLLHHAAGFNGLPEVLLALGIALPVIVLFALLLRYGSLFERAGQLIERLLGEWPRAWGLSGRFADLDAQVRRLYAARGRLLGCAAWQLAGLLSGTLETWLALRWLGHPVNIYQAVALEGLTQGLRQFAFFVPAGLGVQEAGLIGFGVLLGVAGPTALALSLAKRLREVLIGVPALVGWRALAGRVGPRVAVAGE